MTQKRIPTEILLNIASYLSPTEKKESLLICKDWYQIFRYGLYYTVSIKSLNQLELLFKSFLCSSNDTTCYLPNGHLVKSLFIHKQQTKLCTIQQQEEQDIIIPKQLFQQLPNLCPNLEVLDFDPETWKYVHYYHDNISKWKRSIQKLPTLSTMCTLPFLQCLGENITDLSIQSEMIIDISTQQKLFCILSLVPNTIDLDIIGNKSATTLLLGIEDIELIHELLPYLKSFKIVGENIHMLEPNNNFPTTATTTATTEITSLHWNAFLTPATWILYVTHKYPLVQNLTLAINNQTTTQRQQDQQSLYYIQLLKQCQQLKYLSLSSNTMSDWFNPLFFDHMLQTSRIQQVFPIRCQGNQIKFNTELNLALRIKHLITSLEIEQWRLDTKLPFTIRLLGNFTQLNHLEIRCDSYRDTYDMDMILDACPVLDSLVLIWGTISVSNIQRRHPLRYLDITFVAFQSTAFRYLANQCKSLSKLIITRCKQLCELNDIATQTVIHLDMPHNAFDLVILDRLRLDYYMCIGPNYVRILSIDDHQWYQHVGYSVLSDQKIPKIQVLDDKDKEITSNYFLKRELCTFKDSHHRFLETISEQKVNHVLKNNLMFGVIKIKCKSITNFVLDGNFVG